ncbi:MAG TPA: alpha/beta hydrolase [Amycolatopsis sp.]|uniref:alpha/beta fold hydrolase n=1 Tax=Amycolatopsis sp. TaxID=37632 RepID=UPI002B48F824|nr:alpha/beta hydrolase [Amycolatopsis sp.]HKS49170.1 alpha/beta hydrolase [Amycolatopsis sp.]
MRERRCQSITAPVELDVITEDGIRLHAEVSGNPAAPVTVVFCHGYGLSLSSWCLQRAALAGRARVVAWDQRGHGRSEYGEPGSGAIDQLGRDLYQVLEQVAPTGPVVLAGHSMGGMTIMALAEQHPELFGDRVTGVALLATSAGPVNPSLGLPAGAAVLQLAAHRVAEWIGPDLVQLLELVRRLPGYRAAVRRLVRRFAFASAVSTTMVDLLVEMLEGTQPAAATDLFRQFRLLDKRTTLTALQRVSTLVMVGDQDAITPPRDSEVIVAAVPGAELVTLPDTGHALMLERSDKINEWLSPLLLPASLPDVS